MEHLWLAVVLAELVWLAVVLTELNQRVNVCVRESERGGSEVDLGF